MSAEQREDRLRLLVAELEGELAKTARLVAQFAHASQALADPLCDPLVVYGAAALIESFYTGVEKALMRIATALGGKPSGDAWHRDLLSSMTLALEDIRPAVLSEAAAAAIDPYLGFRHRFRNLYVFDLDRDPMRRLLDRGGDAWRLCDADLRAFAARLREWIVALERGAS